MPASIDSPLLTPPLVLPAATGFGSYLIAQNLDIPGKGAINPAARETAIEALNLYWISLGLNLGASLLSIACETRASLTVPRVLSCPAWSPLFFTLQKPILALVDLVALTGVTGMLAYKAHQLPTIHNIPTSLFFGGCRFRLRLRPPPWLTLSLCLYLCRPLLRVARVLDLPQRRHRLREPSPPQVRSPRPELLNERCVYLLLAPRPICHSCFLLKPWCACESARVPREEGRDMDQTARLSLVLERPRACTATELLPRSLCLCL